MIRAILSEASTQLGKGLDWFAVDHWDTSCPHTHILLRGRSADGAELSLSPRFVRRDLRAIASRIAGEELDGKGRNNLWRAELFSEAKWHGPTRLDVLLSAQIDAQGRIAPNNIQGFNADPDLRDALSARAMELVRLGLAHRTKSALVFAPAWRDRLELLARDLSQARSLHQDLSRGRLAFAKDAPALAHMGRRLD